MLNMTKKQIKIAKSIKKQLLSLQEATSREDAHVAADELLCELLISLGFTEIVEDYAKISKWYS
jgi:hypothetical protein